MRISVIGAGSWGTTLAVLLVYNGHTVTLWEYDKDYTKTLSKTRENKTFLPGVKLPEEMIITNSLKDAAMDKHMLVIAVPTQFIRSVLKQISGIVSPHSLVVSVSKGIENKTLATVSQIIAEELHTIPKNNIAVLSGPSHAEEVSRRIPTTVVAASASKETSATVQAVFGTSYFRIYSSEDILGVELAGAVKNVIAIGAGIVDGAGFGDNTKAAIMTRGVAELSRLGTALGAQTKTFAGLSGMGDLIVTCGSRHSRNRYVGEQLGKGIKLTQILKSMKMVAEGIDTCRSVKAVIDKNGIDAPICTAVYQIMFEDKDPAQATYELMTRDFKSE